MSELVANEYGVEFDHIKVTRLRIHRTNGKWLVEYRREPRWFLGLDRWWWFDDVHIVTGKQIGRAHV